ncbi:trace amine-associated receptor 4-like [Gigantopelta aegis]|uniref:trace amine-associated receptor 4-like n=1 Tax=Gigantopelta aegis TaxID=1735272 RepID=UPI001B88880F|nr:trace amine-associated receptor 4-like [Gigantopelta aegis]
MTLRSCEYELEWEIPLAMCPFILCSAAWVISSVQYCQLCTALQGVTSPANKGSSLHSLPPTSQGILPHIQRAFYNAHTTMHALESHLDPETVESLKPQEYGYEHDQGQLMPATSWKTLEVNCVSNTVTDSAGDSVSTVGLLHSPLTTGKLEDKVRFHLFRMMNDSDDYDCNAVLGAPGSVEVPPWSPAAIYAYCLMILALTLAVIAGNSLVIFAVAKFRSLQSRTNAYIVSLAFSDIVLAVLVLPLHLYESWNRWWDLPPWMCQVRDVLESSMVNISVANLCAVAVERYLAVCHPFAHTKVTNRITAVIIALCWVVPLAMWTIYEGSGRRYLGIEDLRYCLFQAGKCVFLLNQYDYYFPSATIFWIPMALIFITYGKIFATARRHARAIQALPRTEEQRKKNKDYLGNTKAAKVLGIVVACFVVCWTPVSLAFILDTEIGYGLVSPVVAQVLAWLGYLNSMMNPILYYIFSQNFKIAFKTIFGFKTATNHELG